LNKQNDDDDMTMTSHNNDYAVDHFDDNNARNALVPEFNKFFQNSRLFMVILRSSIEIMLCADTQTSTIS